MVSVVRLAKKLAAMGSSSKTLCMSSYDSIISWDTSLFTRVWIDTLISGSLCSGLASSFSYRLSVSLKMSTRSGPSRMSSR